jgi:hypothetical protein
MDLTFIGYHGTKNPSVPNHKYKIKSGFEFEIKAGK